MRKLSLFTVALLSVALLFGCSPTKEPGKDPGTTDQEPGKTDDATETGKKDPVVKKMEQILNVQDLEYSTANGETELPVRLYVPADYSEEYAYPVLVFLHGAGERGEDNEAQLKHVIQNLFHDPESPVYQSIVVVPQCPEGKQWVMTPWAEGNYAVNDVEESPELRTVLSYLEELEREYNINKDRIYVMGISMGGFGTWDLIMRHTELFAAAMPVCGGADPSYAEKLKDLPIRTYHGDADAAVPVAGTRAMSEALTAAGAKDFTYIELAGYGHNVWDYASTDKDGIAWLFAQRKK